MNEYLMNVLTSDVYILDLLRYNVLALRKLEDMFLSVDYFEASILK